MPIASSQASSAWPLGAMYANGEKSESNAAATSRMAKTSATSPPARSRRNVAIRVMAPAAAPAGRRLSARGASLILREDDVGDQHVDGADRQARRGLDLRRHCLAAGLGDGRDARAPKTMLMVTSMSTLPSRRSTEMPGVPLSPRRPASARALVPPRAWMPSIPLSALKATLATTLSEMVTPPPPGAASGFGASLMALLPSSVVRARRACQPRPSCLLYPARAPATNQERAGARVAGDDGGV